MENLLLCSKTLYDKDLLDKTKEIEALKKKIEELTKNQEYADLCIRATDMRKICPECASDDDICECDMDIEDHTNCFCAWCLYHGWNDNDELRTLARREMNPNLIRPIKSKIRL